MPIIKAAIANDILIAPITRGMHKIIKIIGMYEY